MQNNLDHFDHGIVWIDRQKQYQMAPLRFPQNYSIQLSKRMNKLTKTTSHVPIPLTSEQINLFPKVDLTWELGDVLNYFNLN